MLIWQCRVIFQLWDVDVTTESFNMNIDYNKHFSKFSVLHAILSNYPRELFNFLFLHLSPLRFNPLRCVWLFGLGKRKIAKAISTYRAEGFISENIQRSSQGTALTRAPFHPSQGVSRLIKNKSKLTNHETKQLKPHHAYNWLCFTCFTLSIDASVSALRSEQWPIIRKDYKARHCSKGEQQMTFIDLRDLPVHLWSMPAKSHRTKGISGDAWRRGIWDMTHENNTRITGIRPTIFKA